MKNHRKSKRALSPVVASIILIAVTVAVSIAVAAWMGALTIGFMGTEEIRVTNAEFQDAPVMTYADVYVKNTGTAAVTIEEIYVNGVTATSFTQWNSTSSTALPNTAVNANDEVTFRVYSTYEDGSSYQFKLVSSKGNPFVYTATAPVA
jgi:flagellin-like protein